MPDSYMLRFGVGGVVQSVDPSILTFNQVADAVNCQIKGSMLESRPGVRIHDLGLKGNFQGATFYNPARGLSQQSFGEDESSLIASIAGKRYQIKPPETIVKGAPEVTLLDTDDTSSGSNYHLAFMKQCENYVISQDGNGNTWIWDGEASPFFSSGYSTEDKENSRLANGASVIGYAHGRVVQVVNNRQIIVGDIIHKQDLTTAANILETTEQTYWATGSFFSPPSELGAIRAVSILPLRDTAHGHGDLMFHTDEGVFSLDLTKYPRETWVDQAITKHVLLDTGAAGFYGITLFDGDQIFLSRHGIQTLRSARAESQRIGNPFLPISNPVRDYVDADTRKNFKYASVEKFVEQRRLFATTQHIIKDSSNRGGRGLLVMNFLPSGGTDQAWEGLWTLPSQAGLINQLVSGVFDTEERMFAFTTDDDDNVFLVEFSHDLRDDVLCDGSTQRIEWQVLTRSDTGGEEAERKAFEKAWATLRGVEGGLSWKTYGRTDEGCWGLWAEGGAYTDDSAIVKECKRDLLLRLGSPPQGLKRGTRMQMLFKFQGKGALEAIKTTATIDRGGNSTPTTQGSCVTLSETGTEDTVYNPFSYSET